MCITILKEAKTVQNGEIMKTEKRQKKVIVLTAINV